jgi:hypothetical protein
MVLGALVPIANVNTKDVKIQFSGAIKGNRMLFVDGEEVNCEFTIYSPLVKYELDMLKK